ncbi:MAG: molybdopterin-guanine dinucleotide biosynthesis protein B [Gammaproteobacteria bacterium]|nr:molybdopterin-guanine dinucleotide biosynthesis protein B [Gammaproteobacteria bacterium]
MKNPGFPIVGFSAWSGTGKTTLLTQVIPRLKAKGLRVAVIKHAHHHFDLDRPGKDSYELRKSGADHTIICTATRMAAITEFASPEQEPTLEQIVEGLDTDRFDILLVEGYKHLAFYAKIELHRAALGKPFLHPQDPTIIALACDEEPAEAPGIPVLDINNPSAIADFIYDEVYSGK